MRIIQQIISYHLGMPIDQIAPECTFEDLGADSLDCVEIVMDIEDKQGIIITNAELEEIKTVQNIYDLVNKKNAEKPVNQPPALEKPKDENSPDDRGPLQEQSQ